LAPPRAKRTTTMTDFPVTEKVERGGFYAIFASRGNV